MSDAGSFFFKICVSGRLWESTGPTGMQLISPAADGDGTRQQNAVDIHSESSHALDSWWQETKRDVKKSVVREMKAVGWNWGQVTTLAGDRKHWHSVVRALNVTHFHIWIKV